MDRFVSETVGANDLQNDYVPDNAEYGYDAVDYW
jgi:hypothetical protein